MKRFRILNYQREVVFKADTTIECFEFLKTKDRSLNCFIVECLMDDIEIDADEFCVAFEDGEYPGDLNFF